MQLDRLSVRIYASDTELLEKLFGVSAPDRGATTSIDGVEVSFASLGKRPGMSTTDLIITVLINRTTGVPTSLLAAWIYSHLAKEGKQPVEIGSDPLVKVGEAQILKAVTNQVNLEQSN
jgi:hypothetical protein